MLYIVKDKNIFKKDNLENWYCNSDFWLEAKMRHIEDVAETTINIILEQIDSLNLNRPVKIIDLGCGEGWIYREIEKSGIDFEYVGLDFNKIFIKENTYRYKRENVFFILHDLEKEPPEKLIEYADIAINFFNFFEIPDIDSAIKYTTKMIKKNGVLLIANIDPIMQILSVCNSQEEFISSLKDYEDHQTMLGYDKDIDIGDQRSNRIYKSILYSTATYVEIAKKYQMQLFDYKEVVKTGSFVPQIYQYIYLKKTG